MKESPNIDVKPILQADISHKLLEALIPKVLAATGQQFIKWALIILTLFFNFLPPSVAKLLNDKLVATLYEKMPRNPTDLTGAIIDLPPDQMGKANRPYARSVLVNESSAHAAKLPNTGVVFDKLLKRSKTEDWDEVSFFFSLLFFSTFNLIKLTHTSSRSTPVDSVRLHSLLVHLSSIPYLTATESLSGPGSTTKLPLTLIYRPCMATCHPRNTRSAITNLVVGFYIRIALRTLVCCSCLLVPRRCSSSSTGTTM